MTEKRVFRFAHDGTASFDMHNALIGGLSVRPPRRHKPLSVPFSERKTMFLANDPATRPDKDDLRMSGVSSCPFAAARERSSTFMFSNRKFPGRARFDAHHVSLWRLVFVARSRSRQRLLEFLKGSLRRKRRVPQEFSPRSAPGQSHRPVRPTSPTAPPWQDKRPG